MTAQDASAGHERHARKKVIGLVVVIVLLTAFLDLAILDRWQLAGRVTDSAGNPIEGVLVLSDFKGQTPVLISPLSPDPRARHQVCMGSDVRSSDANGDFKFDVFTLNHFLAAKSASIWLYKPGRSVAFRTSPIASSLFAPARTLPVVLNDMRIGMGSVRWHQPILAALPAGENNFSILLSALSGLVADAASTCGRQGLTVGEAAMRDALVQAKTFDERFKVRAACRYANTRIRRQWPDSAWPFDCDNLPFRQKPSAEVLAAEAELEARRKAAIQSSSVVNAQFSEK